MAKCLPLRPLLYFLASVPLTSGVPAGGILLKFEEWALPSLWRGGSTKELMPVPLASSLPTLQPESFSGKKSSRVSLNHSTSALIHGMSPRVWVKLKSMLFSLRFTLLSLSFTSTPVRSRTRTESESQQSRNSLSRVLCAAQGVAARESPRIRAGMIRESRVAIFRKCQRLCMSSSFL